MVFRVSDQEVIVFEGPSGLDKDQELLEISHGLLALKISQAWCANPPHPPPPGP